MARVRGALGVHADPTVDAARRSAAQCLGVRYAVLHQHVRGRCANPPLKPLKGGKPVKQLLAGGRLVVEEVVVQSLRVRASRLGGGKFGKGRRGRVGQHNGIIVIELVPKHRRGERSGHERRRKRR